MKNKNVDIKIPVLWAWFWFILASLISAYRNFQLYTSYIPHLSRETRMIINTNSLWSDYLWLITQYNS